MENRRDRNYHHHAVRQPISERRPEHREIDVTSYAPILGGILSSGGEMSFKVFNKHHTKKNEKGAVIGRSVSQRAIPEISYASGNETKLGRLRDLFGGSVVTDPATHLSRWTILGSDAVRMADIVKDFDPSHREAIEEFQKWKERKDEGVRMKLANRLNLKIRGGQIRVSVEAYVELVQNPSYLAGVFESGGRIPVNTDGEMHDEPGIVIEIKSLGLLAAVKEVYGKNNSDLDRKNRRLTIVGEGAGKVLEYVSPHLFEPLAQYLQRPV